MKNVIFTLVGVVVVALLGGLVFVYSGVYNVAATKENSAAKQWLMRTTLRNSVASRAADIKVPDLDDEKRMFGGASHYDAMCADCHGAPGRARAEFAPDLNPKPPHFGEAPPEVDDPAAREIFWVTKYGIEMTGMPAWGPTHSDEELWDMVAFMKKFSKMSGEDYKGWIKKAEAAGHHHGEDDGHGHHDH